ncbi:MAG TPA: hypothetical protein VHJ20_15560 [Polyangia bacterium]|nr:hypothetical protein [Polyangia bacterium]
MKNWPLFVGIAAFALTGCPADDDPGFDDWCGDTLCHWTLGAGQIAKAPTWNERDYGVELVGSPVTLSQQPDVSSASCLELKVIAEIDPAAEVYLELDFRADGTTDYRERIPSVDWVPQTMLVNAPTWYDKVAVTISKESAGHVVLARLEVGPGDGCTGEPIPLVNRPPGAWCEAAEQCTSGACAPSKVCKTTFAACDATPCADGTGPCVDWPATCR